MALVFPRAMPSVGVGRQVFEPQRVDLLSPEGTGRLGSMAVGFPLWSAEWTLGTFGPDRSDEWRAWVASLEGSRRPFYGAEVGREFPRLYAGGFAGLTRAGGGAFDGSATAWSQSISADGQATLQLTGLPALMSLSRGDYVDFRWQTGGEQRRSLVRSLQPVTGSAGGVAAFAIVPAVPALTPGSAIAHLDNPSCIMRLVPQETRITEMDRRRASGGRVVALQDIRP